MGILKNKKIYFLISTILSLSCSTDINIQNSLNNISKENKKFSIKSNPNLIQNSSLLYTGSWSEIGNVHQAPGTINNNNNNFVYTGNWLTYNHAQATHGNYAYVNSGTPIQLANNTSSNVTYVRNGWNTYSAFSYADVNTNNTYRVTNQEVDINKVKYVYTGSLGGGPKQEAWSSTTMHPVWRTQTSSNGISYTESREATSRVEIAFTGTNVQIYQFKTPLMGECYIKVYDINNNEIRSIHVYNYQATWQLSKTIITGLPNGSYKVVIEGINGHRFNFVRAEVYPSIEYKFFANNITYNAFTSIHGGRVHVTINNDPSTTQTIDLYNSVNIYQDVYSRVNLGHGQHTITIDALGERNPLSSGFRINLNEFKAKPSVRGEFFGTFLALKLLKTSNSGIAQLYIDGDLYQEIDMYSVTSSFYTVYVYGLANTTHTFQLVAKNEKHASSSSTRINFDGYTTNKASYTFTGTGVKYFANTNNNQGKVEILIDGVKYETYDLYSSSYSQAQEIVNITGLSNEEHTIDIVPSGVKTTQSSDYGVNVDYLQIEKPITHRALLLGNDGGTFRVYVSDYDSSFWSTPANISSTYSSNNLPFMSKNKTLVTWRSTDKIYISKNNNTSWNSPLEISTTSSTNDNPKTDALGNRVTWQGYDGSNLNIYVSDYNGTSWSTPVNISSSINSCLNPEISEDGNTIAFRGYDGTHYNIYVSKYNGTSWSTPVNISTSSTTNNYQKLNQNGNRITWTGNDGSEHRIYVSDYNGTSWSTPVNISPLSILNYVPEISEDGNRITWKGQNGSEKKIYVSDYNGTSWSTPLEIYSNPVKADEPKMSDSGNTITWNGHDGTTNRVYVSKYDGSSWSSPFNITVPGSISEGSATISSDGNKLGFISHNGSIQHVYISNYNGTSWETPIQISNSSTTMNQIFGIE